MPTLTTKQWRQVIDCLENDDTASGVEDNAAQELVHVIEAQLADDTCAHEPDWTTIQPADGAPGIVDVNCRLCGISGSTRVAKDDIDWE